MNQSEHGLHDVWWRGQRVGESTFQVDSRQTYDCQLVGQKFDTWPKSE